MQQNVALCLSGLESSHQGKLEQKWHYVKILEMSSTLHNNTDFRDFESTSKACQGICRSWSGIWKKYPSKQNTCA